MSSPVSTATDGPHGRTACAATGDHAIGWVQGEEGSAPHARVTARGGVALQDEHVRPQQAAAALTAAQADGCRRFPSSEAAIKHSIPHGVVSQVVSPEIASFMECNRVVVRTHQDELCCVDAVEIVARDPALCAAIVESLEQFPHLIRLTFDAAVVDAQASPPSENSLSYSYMYLSSAAVTGSMRQGSPRLENSLNFSILVSTAVAASMRQGSPRSETCLSYSICTSAGATGSMQQGSPPSENSLSFSVLTSAGATASTQQGSPRSDNSLSFST